MVKTVKTAHQKKVSKKKFWLHGCYTGFTAVMVLSIKIYTHTYINICIYKYYIANTRSPPGLKVMFPTKRDTLMAVIPFLFH